jgi:hypothetical protein
MLYFIFLSAVTGMIVYGYSKVQNKYELAPPPSAAFLAERIAIVSALAAVVGPLK